MKSGFNILKVELINIKLQEKVHYVFKSRFLGIQIEKNKFNYNINGMTKIFYLVLLVALASSSTISIGTCLEFNWEKRQCQKCITSYHLFNGMCLVEVPNCLEYKFGFICQKCSKDTVLINNQCCDSLCLESLFKKQKDQIQQYSIEKNLQTISKVIDYVGNSFVKNNQGKLIKVDVKTYKSVERWFLLYEFQNQIINYQRIVVDYNFKISTFIPVDFSALRNIDDFSTILWKNVEDQRFVLSLFSTIYPINADYIELKVKKAILSEISQYEINTFTAEKVELREIYSHKNVPIILIELSYLVPSTSQTSNPLNISLHSTQFNSYQLIFEGIDISAEMDVNDGLSTAVGVVKNSPYWNHTLKKVVEYGISIDLTQFSIVGQSKSTIILCVINYSQVTGVASIVSINLETVVSDNSTTTQSATTPSTSSSNPQPNGSTDNIQVIQDGCTTHTSYTAPYSDEILSLSEKLLKIKEQAILSQIKSNSTPIIRDPTLISRRIVISAFCQDFAYREVTFVQGDSISTKQYFTYYFEEDIDGDKSLYLLGNNTKTQTTTVYNNINTTSIYFVDPSFVIYPSTSLYSAQDTLTDFLDALTTTERQTFMNLTINMTSEKNRNLGKMSRFTIEGRNSSNSIYKNTGWLIYDQPEGFYGPGNAIATVCTQGMWTQSLTIGGSGPLTSTKSSSESLKENSIHSVDKVNLLRNQDPQ